MASAHAVPRNLALDLIRGLAALGVALYHYTHWTTGRQIESLGTFTVYVFFVLSGLTMMYVYADSFKGGITPRVARTFYLRRFARLFPLLAAVSLASLVVGVVMLNQPAAGAAARSLLTSTGLFGLQMPGYLSNTPGAWSLGIEAVFYVVFPVIAMAATGARLSTIVGVLIGLLVAQHALLLLLQGDLAHDHKRFWDYYISPLTFAPFFAMGILAYRVKQTTSVLNLVLALVFFTILSAFSVFAPGELFANQPAYFALTLVAGATVLFAYAGKMPLALAGVASFFGDISYSLYLTHPFTHKAVEIVAPRLGLSGLAQAALFFGLALAVAYGSYRLLELPSKTWLQNALRAKDTRPAQTTDEVRAANSAP